MMGPGLGDDAARMRDAFERLEQVHRETAQLIDTRTRRRWNAQEYDRYIALLGAERRAIRRYLAAHRAFDARRHQAVRSEADTNP